ncbi:MAG: GAF domain-containing protein [Chloroflexi bacterium]|nr:GAF domain-containing protein [Chloroflexota bacterium]
MPKPLAKAFWALGAVSIRVKIVGMVLGFILLLGASLALRVRAGLETNLAQQLEMRGIAVARDLAARSTDLILTNNTFALYELVKDTLENNDDVRYVFLLDAKGSVLVHSFSKGFPPDLAQANPVEPDRRYRLEVLDTEEGLIRDIAVPILEAKAGIARVGMSERRLREAVNLVTQQVAAATAVVLMIGVATAYVLTTLLTKPVDELVEITGAVGAGDLEKKARVWFDDEVGQLSTALNAMVADLRRSRKEIEESNQQLISRNRELSTLNAIAAAASGAQSLDQMLGAILSKTVSTMRFKAGWIFLVGEDGRHLFLTAHTGLSSDFIREETAIDIANCVCGQAWRSGQAMLVRNLAMECPRLDRAGLERDGIACHISVPLKAKGSVLGIMNVACERCNDFTTEEQMLLSSIGNQIGIAIENARLWEELKRKEELRGQLLAKVITAQEEERKRIARELHDQTSQSLTSLMVGLKLVEGATSLANARARSAELKALTGQTLQEVHDLARELRPSVLDDLGLVAALQRYTGEYSRKFGVAVDFQPLGFDARRLPSEVEIALYRVIQEALTNVVKHAQAKNVSVLLEHRGSSVLAIVEDDGKGFNVPRTLRSKSRANRLGLFGMQERAELLGGRMTLESKPGLGTTIFLELPLNGR